jgi:hypothetical protein
MANGLRLRPLIIGVKSKRRGKNRPTIRSGRLSTSENSGTTLRAVAPSPTSGRGGSVAGNRVVVASRLAPVAGLANLARECRSLVLFGSPVCCGLPAPDAGTPRFSHPETPLYADRSVPFRRDVANNHLGLHGPRRPPDPPASRVEVRQSLASWLFSKDRLNFLVVTHWSSG